MKALAIAAHELRAQLLSPLAWSVYAVVTFIMAYVFLANLDVYLSYYMARLATMEGAPGVTDIVAGGTLQTATIILLLVTPLLTMRLVADERRTGTLTLLLSSPVRVTDIVLGKFLGVLGVMAILLAVIFAMPLSLAAGASLDWGKLAAAALGMLLLASAMAAVGLFMSTLTRHAMVAAVSAFGALLFLWLIDITAEAGARSDAVMKYLSLRQHYDSLLKGTFDSADVAYYLIVTALFLAFSVRRLDADRI
ncbi:MAG TPA: ABC transporter permease [Gammaproteobacteria bacterium]|nr:ABC transporter permease [Gammaproteobacteria bacterium]